MQVISKKKGFRAADRGDRQLGVKAFETSLESLLQATCYYGEKYSDRGCSRAFVKALLELLKEWQGAMPPFIPPAIAHLARSPK